MVSRIFVRKVGTPPALFLLAGDPSTFPGDTFFAFSKKQVLFLVPCDTDGGGSRHPDTFRHPDTEGEGGSIPIVTGRDMLVKTP